MMQFVPPVVVQPPSLLFLAKIVPSIAVIVSRLNALHVPHAVMILTAIVVVAMAAGVVVVMVVVAVVETETAVMVVVETDATAAGKKDRVLEQRVIHSVDYPHIFFADLRPYTYSFPGCAILVDGRNISSMEVFLQ
jgi:hypothetical protein